MSKKISNIMIYNYSNNSFISTELFINKKELFYLDHFTLNPVYITKELLSYLINFYESETGNKLDSKSIFYKIKKLGSTYGK